MSDPEGRSAELSPVKRAILELREMRARMDAWSAPGPSRSR